MAFILELTNFSIRFFQNLLEVTINSAFSFKWNGFVKLISIILSKNLSALRVQKKQCNIKFSYHLLSIIVYAEPAEVPLRTENIRNHFK